LACFYTPLSAQRLEEFTHARQIRNQRRTKFAQIPEYNSQLPFSPRSLSPLPFPRSCEQIEDRFGHELTVTINFSASVSAPDPLVDNTGAALAQPFSTENRFADLRSEQSNSPPRQNDSSFDTTSNPNPLFAANPGATGAEVLANWVLSGYAGTSSGPESPSTSSASISPGYIVEQSSSPETNGSLPGNLIPPPTTNGYVDQSTSFLPSLGASNDYTSLEPSISFPTSTLTNLAQTYSSSDYRPVSDLNGGYTNTDLQARSQTTTPQTYSSSIAQNGLGGDRDAPWPTFSPWKGDSIINGRSSSANANPSS
jgi:hypothetical protein